MSGGPDDGEAWAGWVSVVAGEAHEPLGTQLYKQLWIETCRKKNHYETSTTMNEKQMLKSTRGYENASSS